MSFKTTIIGKPITDLAATIHAANRAKGFWDAPRPIDEVLMLIVSEAAEALEADRRGIRCTADMARIMAHTDTATFVAHFQADVSDTLEDELADVAIRTLDLLGALVTSPDSIEGLLQIVKRKQFTQFYIRSCVGSKVAVELFHIVRCCTAFKNVFTPTAAHLLCDIIAQCYAIAAVQGFDLDAHIEAKLRYNATRDVRHGKAY